MQSKQSPRPGKRGKLLLVVLGVLGLLVGLGLLFGVQPLEVATGYSAKRMCSEIFLAERDAEEIWRVDLSLIPTAILSYEVDREAKIVSVDALGGIVSQQGVYRDGLGCALTNGVSVSELKAMRYDRPAVPASYDASAPWPVGNAVQTQTLPEGVDRAKLERAMALAFEEPDLVNDPIQTRAVVIVYDGQIVAERYAEGFDAETPLLSWSMGKSITNTMIGVLVHEGLLDIAQPAPITWWREEGDPRQKITTKHLLEMKSGLDFDETYGGYGDATDMLFVSHSSAQRAAQAELAAEPGTRWSYSSGDTNLLSQVVRNVLANDARYHAFPTEEIFYKIGAYSAIFETDASGTFVGSSFVYMTARDWARWALLYLRDGVWEGERILPEGWAEYSCSPTPNTPRGEYGAQFWLNRGNPPGSENRPFPSVPTDYCAAQGFETQRVAIFPEKKAIILRLGLTPRRGAFPDDAFFAAALDALP